MPLASGMEDWLRNDGKEVWSPPPGRTLRSAKVSTKSPTGRPSELVFLEFGGTSTKKDVGYGVRVNRNLARYHIYSQVTQTEATPARFVQLYMS